MLERKGAAMLSRSELIDARNQSVVISNRLIQNSYFALTEIQLKSLLYTISKIQETDEPWKEYSLSVRDLCEVCNMRTIGTNTYKGRTGLVYGAMRELRGKHLDLFDEKGRAFNTGWFSKVKMENDNDTVYYTFDTDLMPYLFHLKKEIGYTITHLETLLSMDSPVGMRLYLFLRSIAFRGTTQTVTLDEIRERTGNAGKYDKYKDLRVRVIEPAIEDINKYSDMSVECVEVKKGKKVIALDFTIRDKNRLTDEEKAYKRLNRVKAFRIKPTGKQTLRKATAQPYVNIYKKASKE